MDLAEVEVVVGARAGPTIRAVVSPAELRGPHAPEWRRLFPSRIFSPPGAWQQPL